ncbi:MAG: DMT family transporter [Treponema sp.]|nr:DMT family transporter [Treponema sp.]
MLKEHPSMGQLAILLTAILWSSSGLFVKLLEWHPVVITGVRSYIAVIFLLVLRFISPPKTSVKNAALPLWIGALAFSFTMISFVIANRITTAANAIMLQYSAPIWAAFLAWWLLKEKPRWEHWGALVLVFCGLLLFFRGGLGSGALLGDILSVASGISFGLYTILLRKIKEGNPRDIMLLGHAISAFLSIPFIILYPPTLNATSVSIIFYMGIIQIGLTSVLFAYGMKRVRAIQAMLIATIEPILSPVWVFIVLRETPTLTALAGGTVIVATVLVSSIIGWRREEI